MIENNFPFISVLIAARNEEANIRACLQSLCTLDYPLDRFEILIGDDHSTDDTAAIVQSFIPHQTNLKLISITDSLLHLKGKTNVIAQLAHVAKGEYLFLTDADVIVPKSWLTSLVSYFKSGNGLVMGITAITENSLFARMQNAEWLIYAFCAHIAALKGKPILAMGSNMAVSKKAYTAIGGYEKLPFTVNEDYMLSKAIIDNKSGYKSAFNHSVLAYTNAVTSLPLFFKQRKRLFRGITQLPVPFMLPVLIYMLLLPLLLIVGLVWGFKLAITIFIVKWIMELYFLLLVYRYLSLKPSTAIILYTPYSAVLNIVFFVWKLFSKPIEWKGRTYAS